MKLLTAILLVVLLSGCTAMEEAQSATTAAETIQTTQSDSTEPPGDMTGTYVPESAVERRTSGAVRVYEVPTRDCMSLCPMGEALLLFSGSETTTITVLKGENLAVGSQVTLDCLLTAGDGSVQVSQQGIAYFDKDAGAVVFLDSDLREVRRVELPDHHAGSAAIAPSWDKVYYCTESEVYAMDLHTGFSRLIKSHSAEKLTLTGVFFDGTMLSCYAENDQRGKTVYFSAETGETYYDDRQLMQLSTGSDTYFAAFEDGTVRVCLTGSPGNEPNMLSLPQTVAIHPLPGQNAAVTVETLGSDAQMRYLDLETGKLTGAVTLKSGADITCVAGSGGSVWVILRLEASNKQFIYQWNPGMTPLGAQQSCLRDYTTAQNPDEAGLERCREIAQVLGDKYNTNIVIWEDAAALQPQGYTFEPEYQPEAYERDLALLDGVLAGLPEEFLEDAAAGTSSGKLTVGLVREIDGGTSREDGFGIQYWQDGSAYIVLEMGSMLEQSFYHELSHVIDNRVLSTTLAYDAWAELNPEGFTYDYNYMTNRFREDGGYLEDGDRAFIDIFSMSYPMEDRARILEYAAMPGNASLFESETMQRKLQTVCLGIREAFGLNNAVSCPWEQYLHETLPEEQ